MTDRFRAGATNNAGKLVFDDPQSVKALIAELGPRVTVTFETERKGRSAAQNRLLWDTYTYIAQGLAKEWNAKEMEGPAPDKDEVHAMMKSRFLKRLRKLPNGQVVDITGSTTDLSTTGLSEYLEQVCAQAAEWGIFVPMPGDTE